MEMEIDRAEDLQNTGPAAEADDLSEIDGEFSNF